MSGGGLAVIDPTVVESPYVVCVCVLMILIEDYMIPWDKRRQGQCWVYLDQYLLDVVGQNVLPPYYLHYVLLHYVSNIDSPYISQYIKCLNIVLPSLSVEYLSTY